MTQKQDIFMLIYHRLMAEGHHAAAKVVADMRRENEERCNQS